MSAPVKGRLLDPVEDEVAATVAGSVPVPVDPAVACTVGVLEVPAITGVTLQFTPDIDPQSAAPATPDAMASEASAKPEPINIRLAHIMVALPSVRAVPLRTPDRLINP